MALVSPSHFDCRQTTCSGHMLSQSQRNGLHRQSICYKGWQSMFEVGRPPWTSVSHRSHSWVLVRYVQVCVFIFMGFSSFVWHSVLCPFIWSKIITTGTSWKCMWWKNCQRHLDYLYFCFQKWTTIAEIWIKKSPGVLQVILNGGSVMWANVSWCWQFVNRRSVFHWELSVE